MYNINNLVDNIADIIIQSTACALISHRRYVCTEYIFTLSRVVKCVEIQLKIRNFFSMPFILLVNFYLDNILTNIFDKYKIFINL